MQEEIAKAKVVRANKQIFVQMATEFFKTQEGDVPADNASLPSKEEGPCKYYEITNISLLIISITATAVVRQHETEDVSNIRYTSVQELVPEGRVIVFDLETSGFSADDRY